jgi:two-component system OmpR family sensor kinase
MEAHLPLKRVPTDVRALVNATMSIFADQAAAADVSLTARVDDDVPAQATVDPEKTAWAISTLIGNALRFVRRGTRRMPGGSIDVHVKRGAEPGALAIEVADDGPGIPGDKLPWLFRRREGEPIAAGLALCLVRDVALAHGGDVDVRSSTEAEHGTSITVSLGAAG